MSKELFEEIARKGTKYFSDELLKDFTRDILDRIDESIISYYINIGQKEDEVQLEFSGLTKNFITDITQTEKERTIAILPIKKIDSILIRKEKNNIYCIIKSITSALEYNTNINSNYQEFNNHMKEIENLVGRVNG